MIDPRIKAAFAESNRFELDDHLAFGAYIGSTSHGTYVPKDDPDSIDDVDSMLVVIPPPERTFGVHVWEHWVFQREELDVCAYSLRKLVGLLLKSNPNVVGLLWLREQEHQVVHPVFRRFIEHRDVFSSRRAYQAFCGYAAAQIKKMHGLAFEGYMGAKRKELVNRHGYDTKNGAHAIRLLRMGVEFLRTGTMTVYREHDGEEIRAIKRGEWPLSKLQAEAERLFAEAREARAASPLPEHPNEDAVDEMLVSATLDMWGMTA